VLNALRGGGYGSDSGVLGGLYALTKAVKAAGNTGGAG